MRALSCQSATNMFWNYPTKSKITMIISTNVPIKHHKRNLGEIDIVAQKGNRFDLYEVKCSYRIVKAKKQLRRIKKYLNLKNVRSFFYCGNSKLLVTV